MFGGGWKQFYTQKVDKYTVYRLIEEVLGISERNVVEFFGAVEHPILYTDCKRHHFHVPVYSRVIIRDVDTLEPVPYGVPGLLNLMTPLAKSMPILSIMTDDIAILHPPGSCGCGIESPWLEILGRVGIKDIVTCAAGAQEFLGGA
ncbi:MAG: acyl-protein synthetase, partial [Butyricicoccus sp.]|nr:acyl-protein synthetase [Butyricicoccus sp.]